MPEPEIIPQDRAEASAGTAALPDGGAFMGGRQGMEDGEASEDPAGHVDFVRHAIRVYVRRASQVKCDVRADRNARGNHLGARARRQSEEKRTTLNKNIVLGAMCLLLCAARLSAQPAPGVFTTLKATSTAVDAVCIGCPIATQVPAANSGARLASITIDPYAAPTVTTNKLYNIAGALQFNGVTLATGSTISGSVNTIGMFTGIAAMGNSLLTQSGTTVTMAGTLAATTLTGAHTGSGAGLTGLPTSAIASGNYVATLTSGTGITATATGTGSTPTISLNNTAVVPGSYPMVTVDQQGRITSGTAAVIASTVNATAGNAMFVGTAGAGQNASLTLNTIVSNGFSAAVNFNSKNSGGTTRSWSMGTAVSGADAFQLYDGASLAQSWFFGGGTALGGANLTDAIATPTINTCGGGASIVGKAYGFRVTVGTGSPTACVVDFNTTFANTPACTLGRVSAGANNQSPLVNPGTTQISITGSNITTGGALAFLTGETFEVLCRGY